MHVSWYLFGCARYRSPKSVSDKGPGRLLTHVAPNECVMWPFSVLSSHSSSDSDAGDSAPEQWRALHCRRTLPAWVPSTARLATVEEICWLHVQHSRTVNAIMFSFYCFSFGLTSKPLSFSVHIKLRPMQKNTFFICSLAGQIID